MNDIDRIRKLAGLVEDAQIDITNQQEVNDFVNSKLEHFINNLLENTSHNLKNIMNQVDGIELSRLSENNLTKLSEIKSVVNMLSHIKKKGAQ